jgi:predicted dehydrogenase
MRIGRRRFVKGFAKAAGAVAGGAALARAALGEPASGASTMGAPAIGEPRSYRACVIGSTGRGNYGHGLDTAFQRIPGVSVVALADPDEKGRTEGARRSGAARTYADWREMLRSEKPDLVSIGPRWPIDRAEMVTAAAEVGAHVYMEKPIARDLLEADAIVEIAERRGIRIVVAHQVREAPALLHLRRQIEEGLIGDLLELRTRGKEDHRSGGEDLMVLGTHCMYLMRAFAGPASWCSARVSENGREIVAGDRREATEPLGPVAGDTIHATYAFGGGVVGHFASQKRHGGPPGSFQISIHGSKGVVLVHIDQEPEIYWLPDPVWSPGRSKTEWRPLEGAPSSADPSGLRREEAANKRAVEGLIRWIETGEESPISIREGRAALEMILAVYASHLRGARAALPLAERKHPLSGDTG